MKPEGYLHYSNAGNKSDRWKHKILLGLARLVKPKIYFETHGGFPINIDRFQKPKLSSWMKVYLNFGCHCTICDLNEEVAEKVVHPNTYFIQGNGWELIHQNPGYDLYFVDPPFIDVTDFLSLSLLFCNFRAPIVGWYPIFKDLIPYKFNELHREIIFDEPDGLLVGCGMLFKNIEGM